MLMASISARSVARSVPFAFSFSQSCLVVFFAWLTVSTVSVRGQEHRKSISYRERLLSQSALVEMGSGHSQPLCGIYAGCRALDLVGYSCDPADFVTAHYISDRMGSTPDDLLRMIDKVGAEATPLMFLSKLELELLGAPVIANVRSRPSATVHDHWVCVFPEGSGLTVFDGPYAGKSVAPADLLPVWNGYALFVGQSNWNAVFWVWVIRILAVLLLMSPTMLLLYFAGRTRSPVGFGRQTGALIVTTLAVALLGQFLFGDLTNYQRGIRLSVLPWFPHLRQTVSMEDFVTFANDDNYLLLDTRFTNDFAYGSVPGAVNIPFYLPATELERCFDGIPKDVSIVLFCQSSTCGFSETLGEKLEFIGFENVMISDVGINELREANVRF